MQTAVFISHTPGTAMPFAVCQACETFSQKSPRHVHHTHRRRAQLQKPRGSWSVVVLGRFSDEAEAVAMKSRLGVR